MIGSRCSATRPRQRSHSPRALARPHLVGHPDPEHRVPRDAATRMCKDESPDFDRCPKSFLDVAEISFYVMGLWEKCNAAGWISAFLFTAIVITAAKQFHKSKNCCRRRVFAQIFLRECFRRKNKAEHKQHTNDGARSRDHPILSCHAPLGVIALAQMAAECNEYAGIHQDIHRGGLGLAISLSRWQCGGHGNAAGFGFVR